MNLIDFLVINTLDQVGRVSQHSMLMRFRELDSEIAAAYNTRTYKENFHDLGLYMKQIEARSILKALSII